MPYTVDAGGRVRSTRNNVTRGNGAEDLWEAIQQGGGVIPPWTGSQETEPFPGTQSPSEILAGYETNGSGSSEPQTGIVETPGSDLTPTTKRSWAEQAMTTLSPVNRSVESSQASGLNDGKSKQGPQSSKNPLNGSYWDSLQRYMSGNAADEEDSDKEENDDGSALMPMVQTASMSSPQSASDNRFKKPDSFYSDETNLHGERYEIPWFPWDEAGPTRANDAYERDMVDNGLSIGYIDRVLREDNPVDVALDASNGMVPKWRNDLMDQLTTSVDDGTMDRPHLLSDWMTGDRYYHYVHDLGMQGMPEDQIDVSDDSRYSKAEQQQMYGFTPYVPTMNYLLGKDTVPNVAAATRKLSDYVSNLRSRGVFNDVDYGISTDTGYGYNSFSGRGFEREAPGYLSQANKLYEAASRGDADALSRMISDPGDGPYTALVKQTTLPDGSVHYGVLSDAKAGYDVDMQGLIDGGTVIYGNDGIPLSFAMEDGHSLNIVPTAGGGYGIDTKDDAYKRWNDDHSVYRMEFSDGSLAEVPLSDINAKIAESGGIGDVDWVQYDKSGLDVEPRSLTIGDPAKLTDTYDPFTKTGAEVGAYFSPDLVLSDGTRITYDVAKDILSDTDPDDSEEDGISYSFQRGGLNPLRGIQGIPYSGAAGAVLGASSWPLFFTDSKPRRLMDQMPFDDEGFHYEDLPNNLADWAANSMTISIPYAQWVNAFSQAMPYFSGVNGQGRNEMGRYRATGLDPDDNRTGFDSDSVRNVLMAAPVLAGPALENLAGNIGHDTWLDKPVESFIDRHLMRGSLANILAHHGFDAFGEGIEENVGDVFDELGTYGRDAYTNPLLFPPGDVDIYDEDGGLMASAEDSRNLYGPWPTMYDKYGRELRDPDTSVADRVANFIPHTPNQLRDAANSFIGGAGVSALMGGPSLVGEGFNSHLQRKRGDWGSPSYAQHMNALNRDFPYAGKSLAYARDDMRRRDMDRVSSPSLDVELPESLMPNQSTSKDDSDIIRYRPGKYAIPDDALSRELK